MRPHPYAEFLDRLLKPGRYTGGEAGARAKDWDAVDARIALCFPDVYDIGMSHLGLRILYRVLNDDARTLAERCYAPWKDLEAELRARSLPLVSLETYRPLSSFDVVGFSLQFELTYTNVLNMLELGGIALRSEERGEDAPLVVAGGPNATHPEPLAPFVDAFVIGDGEAKLTELALAWTRLRADGRPRHERLRALASLGGIYVPSLYDVRSDPECGLLAVAPPSDPDVPFPIRRTQVRLADYPFPDDGPTGGPEAIFDRTSIEITRGCTEGCRFCQAGMIYRPVQERDPEEVIATVMSAVKKSGNDEVSLTALSTADVSYIHPLIKKLAPMLEKERVSLSVSSLRAYGLAPELLDELSRVRAGGLTFAPEAGSQRMRDVVNKNVTEEQLQETAERVFSRGFNKMKLYFMIGLPTELDEDVRGIAETGVRAAETGRKAARAAGHNDGRVEVTVSVSTHVPKPHTPFQWCAMDPLAEVDRKQALLKETLRVAGQGPLRRASQAVRLRTHDAHGSVLEGILARGDRRLGDVILHAFKNGARFDSWDDELKLEVWQQALAACEIVEGNYLGTIPVKARLPWSHIDVALEDGFLAREYRRAVASRLSPPCSKVAGAFIHPKNVEEHFAQKKRLVCYDCGVACDLGQMRDERLVYLRKLGADAPDPPKAPEEVVAPPKRVGKRVPPLGDPRAGARYRLRFEKTGPAALLGHLDLVRELPRLFRRLDVPMIYSGGFHPKPQMTFSSALSLGVASLDEYLDVRLGPSFADTELAELVRAMTERAPVGLTFVSAQLLGAGEPPISKLVHGARCLLAFAAPVVDELARTHGMTRAAWLEAACRRVGDATALRVRRQGDGRIGRVLDLRPFVGPVVPSGEGASAILARAGFYAAGSELVCVEAAIAIRPTGSAKISEVAALLAADAELTSASEAPPHRAVRVAFELGAPQEIEASVASAPHDSAVAAQLD